jgi:hypothetical protein
MRALMELALEATGKAERLLNALEKNPSRLALINAFVLIEDLLKTELRRCHGYSQRALGVSFARLSSLARKEFGSAPNLESWTLLDNLAKLRDCAARFTTTRMPLRDILPQALLDKFSVRVLDTPCMNFLQPRLAEVWRFITQFAYLQVSYSILSAKARRTGEELEQEFRKALEYLSEYLDSPEGGEMLALIDGPESPTGHNG